MRKGLFSSYHSSTSDEPLINLTPLIDVVFIVLILFILIAPLLEIDLVSLPSNEGKSQVVSYQTPSLLKIVIHKDSSLWIGKRKVSLKELKKYVAAEKAKNPGLMPQLFLDKSVPFGTYQTVKNYLESAGYSQMEVVLKPSS